MTLVLIGLRSLWWLVPAVIYLACGLAAAVKYAALLREGTRYGWFFWLFIALCVAAGPASFWFVFWCMNRKYK